MLAFAADFDPSTKPVYGPRSPVTVDRPRFSSSIPAFKLIESAVADLVRADAYGTRSAIKVTFLHPFGNNPASLFVETNEIRVIAVLRRVICQYREAK
jgi:hypothetical protein